MLVIASFPARSSCSTKAADPKPNIEQGDVKATTPKLFGSSYMLAPKQGEVLNRKVNQQEPTKKAPVTIMIDSDDDSEGHASWVILNTEPGTVDSFFLMCFLCQFWFLPSKEDRDSDW